MFDGHYHRMVLAARQKTTSSRSTTSSSQSHSSSTSTTTPTTQTKDIPISVVLSTSSVSHSPTPSTSSQLSRSTSTTSTSLFISFSSSSSPTPTSTSSVPPAASSAPATNAASSTQPKSSAAGAVIGILLGIAAVVVIGIIITKRMRKQRDKVDDAQFFDKEKLERSAMVPGFASGPGINSPAPSLNNNFNGPPSPSAYRSNNNSPFESYQDLGAPPIPGQYGQGPFESYHQDLGAPPMPGHNGPAPYGTYPSPYPPMTQRTPPGSPFAGGVPYPLQNPFTPPVPQVQELHFSPSVLASPALPRSPMASTPPPHHPPMIPLPLIPGAAAAAAATADESRDSRYSAACSEVPHVSQAYKVQVGVSMPTYEDLSRESSPPPPFTPFDPAAGVVVDVDHEAAAAAPVVHEPLAQVENAQEDRPSQVVDNTAVVDTDVKAKALPARPQSTQTVYNSEDAYGGM